MPGFLLCSIAKCQLKWIPWGLPKLRRLHGQRFHSVSQVEMFDDLQAEPVEQARVRLAVWCFQLIAELTKLSVAPQGVRIGMRMVRGLGT